ncbi:unnamed protein product [Rhodiola kirilowii]
MMMMMMEFPLPIKFLIISLFLFSALLPAHSDGLNISASVQFPHTSKKTLLLDLHQLGAAGDGLTDATQVLKDAWNIACSFTGRSTILLPTSNKYLVGPIDFAGPCRSKVTVLISGTLLAPDNPDIWKGLNRRRWLYFINVKQLTVDGGGIVNGMGAEWWARSCKRNSTNRCRPAPTAITFHKCRNLKVRNLQMVDSQQMHMAFTSCVHVKATHLSVIAPGTSPNTDGIHISSSSGVEVKKSLIGTGDDCISIVGNSSRIRISDVACGPGHGISVGSLGKSDTSDQIRDVLVESVSLTHTQNGLRIKTWQGGSGLATKITFKNVRMQNVSHPIIVDQFYCDSSSPCLNQTSAVKVANISFIDIRGTSASEEAVRFACSDTVPCQSIYLEDIQLVSQSTLEDTPRSFCWNAYGSYSGLVYPQPCLSCIDTVITQKVTPVAIESM